MERLNYNYQLSQFHFNTWLYNYHTKINQRLQIAERTRNSAKGRKYNSGLIKEAEATSLYHHLDRLPAPEPLPQPFINRPCSREPAAIVKKITYLYAPTYKGGRCYPSQNTKLIAVPCPKR